MFGSLGLITGQRLIVSQHAYKIKTVVRGLADKRRPNNKKMLYRRVTIRIPLIYKMGDMIICAPEYEQRIRQAFQQSVNTDVSPRAPILDESSRLVMEYLHKHLR